MTVHKENKPPEVLMAQVSAYAVDALPSLDERAHILNNIGKFGVMDRVEDVTVGSMLDAAEGPARERLRRLDPNEVLLSADGYVEFLRRSRGSANELIHGRAELLSRYESFAPQIKALKAEILSSNTKNRPKPVGEGANSKAYSIFSGDHEYIAIIPTYEDERGIAVDNRVRGLIKARGIDGLEQAVAASTEEGVTVSERIPGTPLSKIPLATLESISQEDVDRLLGTIIAAYQEVEIDYANTGNFLYEQGFGIVDVSEAQGKPDLHYQIEQLAAMIGSLTSLEAQDLSKPKEEVLAAVLRAQIPKLGLLDKLEKSLRKQFYDADERGFVGLVSEQIEAQKRSEKYLAAEFKIG